MAAAFIDYDPTTPAGRLMARALQLLREGKEVLSHVREILIQMRDGNGSQDAHYALNATEIGFASATTARASFEELDSLHAKVTAGAGVGDATGAAIIQACAKHGV